MMFDIVVIGGGPAGVVAALRARELGATVALVERGTLGGSCVNDGCVPTRVLAKAARLMRDASQFAAYGLSTLQPGIDFAQLRAKTCQIIQETHQKKQLISNLEQAGVEMFTETGAAHFVDEHTIITDNGTTLHAEKYIICVGGHARRLDFPGSEHVLTYDGIWSLPDLPRSLIVVGGSATGCQIASIFAAFGTQVTLVDVAPQLLPGTDTIIADEITNAFQERGIRLIRNTGGVQRIEQQPEGLQLWYTQDEHLQSCVADAVLMAVGWPGNTKGLNLEAAGVATTERGYIVVDDYLRTSTPNIFAAGDITGRMMLVQSADHQGRIAAENAMLGDNHRFTTKIVPYGGFTDPEYAGVGLTERQAEAEHDCAVAVVAYADLDRAVIDGQTVGSCKLIVDRQTHGILGAHVVGQQALEIVQIVATGMMADMRVDQLAKLKIAYPTFAAILGVAARQIVRELGIMPLAPHWRDLREGRTAEWERSRLYAVPVE